MKILHTSDWHLGKNLYDFSLLEDQAHFIRWLLELLARDPVDAVVIAGDIYDRPVPSGEAVTLYDRFLSGAVAELGVPVIAIAGNHDSAARLQFGSSLYQRSGYHVVGSPEAVLHRVVMGNACFTLAPYLHLAGARALFPDEAVKTFDDAYRVLLGSQPPPPAGLRQVVVAHGFFSDLGENADPLLTSDSEIGTGGMDIVSSACFTGYDYAALGHLHAPQRAGDRVRYSGSPLKYSLSEERQRKSVALVELDGDRPGVDLVPVPALRDVRTVRGTLEQLLEPSFHENRHFGDYVFADIEGPECAYPMQKLRALFPRLLGLRFVSLAESTALPSLRLTAAGQRRLSTEALFERFYRDCRGEALPDACREAVAESLEALRKEGVPL